MIKITCDDAVRALKRHGPPAAAKHLARMLDTDSRAVATALRNAVYDGRVTTKYVGGIAYYRFVRLTAK